MKKIFLFIFLGFMPLLFSACVSVSTENLDTTTTITTTIASSIIQLHRVSATQRTIFFLWKNNTKINEQLNTEIIRALQQSGYRLMETPQQAHDEVKITLLQVGLANPQQLKEIMASDYNDPLLTLAPADVSDHLDVSDADVINLSGLTPVMVLDVQVSEKSAEGNSIAWNRYQTRIITRSVQPNVSFQQEQAQMNREAVAEIGKIFS